MNEYHVIVSPRAASDIADVHATIAANNPLNATRFVAKMVKQIDGLERLPERFPKAPEAKHFNEPLRHVTVWPYRIVFRIRGGCHRDRHRAPRRTSSAPSLTSPFTQPPPPSPASAR